MSGGGSEEGPSSGASAAVDFWWDVAGWALLGAAVVGGIFAARTAAAVSK